MFSFNHVTISVDNLDKTLEFYKKFGFEKYKEYRDENVDIVMLKLGDMILEIFHYQEKEKLPEHSKELAIDLKTIGNKHFGLGVKDIVEAKKFVEAAKGTNLFFAVYESVQEDEATGKQVCKRTFATIPLNEVIKRKKQGLPAAPEDLNGNLPKFVLSPNDLVYLPTEEERNSSRIIQPLDRERIYKMVSSSGSQCFFIKVFVANSIWDKNEYSSLNKMERAITNEMIKEICVPIKIIVR